MLEAGYSRSWDYVYVHVSMGAFSSITPSF